MVSWYICPLKLVFYSRIEDSLPFQIDLNPRVLKIYAVPNPGELFYQWLEN